MLTIGLAPRLLSDRAEPLSESIAIAYNWSNYRLFYGHRTETTSSTDRWLHHYWAAKTKSKKVLKQPVAVVTRWVARMEGRS